jgi:hypothetical protein
MKCEKAKKEFFFFFFSPHFPKEEMTDENIDRVIGEKNGIQYIVRIGKYGIVAMKVNGKVTEYTPIKNSDSIDSLTMDDIDNLFEIEQKKQYDYPCGAMFSSDHIIDRPSG